jgi:hypothetical protein
MGKRKPRQSYNGDFKIKVVAESFEPGVSVSRVARRHDINANLLFGWRKDPRYQPGSAAFLPVMIDPALPDAQAGNRVEPPGVLSPELGIWIGGDIRLVVKGGFEPEALGTLIRSIRQGR